MGSYDRVVREDEIKQRLNMRRSLVYTRDIKAGETLRTEDITAKRPGAGYGGFRNREDACEGHRGGYAADAGGYRWKRIV